MRINRDTVANAVAALCRHFRETTQVVRWTIHPDVRLDLLLKLNHQRYEEEVKAGLHDKGAKKKAGSRKRKKVVDAESELFE
jgi:hypothetical protein